MSSAPPTPVVSQPVLTTADWEAPGTFDPRSATTVARLRADSLVFARLWTTDPAGRLVADLASRVPPASSGSLTVILRRGLEWSDGQPLTASDVVYSCELECAGPTAVELSTTAVRFATTAAAALTDLFVVPEHRARAQGFFAAPDVASGPFELGSSPPGQLVFRRNDHYHRGAALIAEIREVLSPSHDGMLAAARAGEFDYLPHLGPADLGGAFGDLIPRVTVSNRIEFLVPRGLSGREAAGISFAVLRAALSEQAFAGAAQPLGGPTSLSASRWLLGPEPARLTLLTLCDDPVRDQEAALLVAQLAMVGLAVHPACGPLAQVMAPATAPEVALYADEAAAVPPGAIPLLRWPELRAVSPHLHGFVPNDTSATDFWNVSGWWLG